MAKPIIVLNTGPLTREHRAQLNHSFDLMEDLKREYHILVLEGEQDKGVQVFYDKDMTETTVAELKQLILDTCRK